MTLEEYLENIPAYKDMEYYFAPNAEKPRFYDVYAEDRCIGIYFEELNQLVESFSSPLDEQRISTSFEMFRQRPEYASMSCIETLPQDIEDMQLCYEISLVGAYLQRYFLDSKQDPDTQIHNSMYAVEWLRKCGFYQSPASTRFHESYAGGLVLHSLRVSEMVKQLVYLPVWRAKISLPSAILCALVHDWCKIGMYEAYNRNVKDEVTGEWHQVVAYRTSGKFIVPAGHGVSSYFLASRFYRLTPEEMLAIRWHMGEWRVAEDDVNELQTANEKYPLVHLLQFADKLSITDYAFVSTPNS